MLLSFIPIQVTSGYLEKRKQRGRMPIMFVDLVFDYCANAYGVSPCTAAGSFKCYNTFKTCQDTVNFSRTQKTYRFCHNLSNLPNTVDAFPALETVDLAPSKIEAGGIGRRASITATFRDFPHHDRGIDPYVSTRNYIPYETGSFFGKLKARNPYYVNRKMIIRTGYIDPETFDGTLTNDFETRTYFIEKWEVNTNGQVRITAKDALKLASNAQAPLPSDGELNADITNSDTSLTLASGYASTYPNSGVVRINEELITYSGKSGDTLTGLSRGQYNTVADAHSTGDSVQLCTVYTSQKPCDIIYDLLVTYAKINPSFITLSDWVAENDAKLSAYNMTAIITEPTEVIDLVEEVLTSCNSYIWWDEVAQLVRFKVMFPVDRTTPITYLNDEKHILESSVTVKDEDKKRIPEYIVYYNQFNPVEDDKKSNFSNVYAYLDTDAEGDNEYGVKATQEITTRWLSGSAPIVELASRTVQLYRTTLRTISFKLDAKDSGLKTGDFAVISCKELQAASGQAEQVLFLITKRAETKQGTTYDYEGIEFNLGGKIAYVAPNIVGDYSVESEANKLAYGFIANSLGKLPDDSEAYIIA